MCRSTDYHNFTSRDRYRDCLNIKGFFVRLSGLRAHDPLPDSLTLLYLDAVGSNTKTRPEPKAFVTLHRIVSVEGPAIFGSRERVRAGDGARFEVYFADQRALKGGFRREGQNWNLECRCALESETVGVGVQVAECEVCVAADGHVALTERVGMVVVKRRRRAGFGALETIPEEREEDPESDGCCCTCACSRDWEKVEVDGGDSEEWCDVDLTKTEMEQGVGWAVDVGLWVVCLGVGYVVSKSSAKTLRRLKIL